MKRPDFLSYQELLDQECVTVPDALRVDTKPEIPPDLIATDRWTYQGVFDKEVSNLWPKVWQMVCR